MSKAIRKTFGKRLKKLRLREKLTQEELALEVDLSNSMIGKYENANTCPSLVVAKRIADFFGVKIDDMIT